MNTGNQGPPIWFEGIALVRITTGILLIFHGLQVFETQDMTGFSDLLFNMSIPFPEAMAYTGKVVELVGGIFMIVGLFTRPIATLLFVTFLFITFVMGEGKIFTDNQHPFLFALISLMFLFTGAGRVSIDHILFMNSKDDIKDSGASGSKIFGRYDSTN